jgi:hypothetical protein
MKALLRGLSQFLFVLAGLSFFLGGLAISILTKTDRISGELAGIGLAVVCGILGFAAKSAGDNLVDGDD